MAYTEQILIALRADTLNDPKHPQTHLGTLLAFRLIFREICLHITVGKVTYCVVMIAL